MAQEIRVEHDTQPLNLIVSEFVQFTLPVPTTGWTAFMKPVGAPTDPVVTLTVTVTDAAAGAIAISGFETVEVPDETEFVDYNMRVELLSGGLRETFPDGKTTLTGPRPNFYPVRILSTLGDQ